MNSFINTLLVLLLFPILLITIWVGFDIPLDWLHTTGQQLPYKNEIFLAFGLLLFVIHLRRAIRRWMGLKMVNQIQKFEWNEVMDAKRIRRIQVYTGLEIGLYTGVGVSLYYISPLAIPVSLAFGAMALDSFIFVLYGSFGNRFRVGITSKALVAADREVSLLYFNGLRKIEIFQNTLFFNYIKDLRLHIPLDCIAQENKERFFETLDNQLDTSKVFVTKKRS